jgi:hypothetical protein
MNFKQISGRILHKNWLQHIHQKSTLAANYLNYGKYLFYYKIKEKNYL